MKKTSSLHSNNRMYQIKHEMKLLKDKASKERLEMKREQRMATLQDERDWFRKEALGKHIPIS